MKPIKHPFFKGIKARKGIGIKCRGQGSRVKGQKPDSNFKLRTHFILGGARSGKSSFALRLAESIGSRNIYIATAEAQR